MKLMYLGPNGSYSSIAAERFAQSMKDDIMLQEMPTIFDVFQAVAQQEVLGLVPLENSTSGDVYDTYTLLEKNNIQILKELILPIQHALIVLRGSDVKRVKRIYSHPQALLQITGFTEEHALETVATQSTMDACLVVLEKNKPEFAAVAQSDAVKHIAGLEALPLAISNHETNYTRFLVIQAGMQKIFNGNTIFLIFSLSQDAPGGLTAILEMIATRGINMKNIKSRPIEGEKFQYYFVVEGYCGHMSQEEHENLRAELKQATQTLTYSVYETEEEV